MHHNPQAVALRKFQAAALAAAILTFIVVVSGGLVTATGSGGACPDWPTCLGRWTPPQNANALLDYTHRAATVLGGLAALAAAWLSGRLAPPRPTWQKGSWAVVALMAAQAAIGALLPASAAWLAGLNMLHLILSLVTLALLAGLSAAAYYPQTGDAPAGQGDSTPNASTPGDPEPGRPTWVPKLGGLRFASPFSKLSLAAAGLLFILLVSGALVKATAASTACIGWPVCTPVGWSGWFSLGHRLMVLFSAMLMAALLWRAWRTQRSQPAILTASTAAAVLFFAQALLGARLVEGFPAYLQALHQATAAAGWAAMAVQLTVVGLAQRTADQEAADALETVGRRGLAKDLLMLTKPIVVALLLVTTYAGMVIGAQAWPSAQITFWTLLGGFLAAGGSGAMNQYIDRYDDEKMQRTQKRPLPSKRLTPAEGLAFGVGIALASFYLLTAFVNILAALLSLAGIIYYVLLYSIFLKKATVQNIVIGGGAGAIPPLVGWAAATGSLNFPSLLLFALVFMWTPPHFWALALVRSSDYARAGVPMLPVVRGERETRWQIFIYTVELVALSLALPVLGLGGAIYLALAAVLGLWLLSAAYRVWKGQGNKVAWKMYRYSSMYLAFLFFALMLDRLIL